MHRVVDRIPVVVQDGLLAVLVIAVSLTELATSDDHDDPRRAAHGDGPARGRRRRAGRAPRPPGAGLAGRRMPRVGLRARPLPRPGPALRCPDRGLLRGGPHLTPHRGGDRRDHPRGHRYRGRRRCRRSPGAPARPRPPRRPGRAGAPRRSRRGSPRRGSGGPAPGGRRRLGLPDRAGGPHQRAPPRRLGPGRRRGALRLGRGGRRGDRRRCGHLRPPPRPTHRVAGLVGMRERASLLGGSLEAGPRQGGGFRVLATLPV